MPRGGPRPNSGRKPGTLSGQNIDARIEARRYAAKAFKTLEDMLTSPLHPVRVSAATQILDRAYGKPGQAVELTGKDGGPVQHENLTNDLERFTSLISGLAARAAEEPAAEEPSSGS